MTTVCAGGVYGQASSIDSEERLEHPWSFSVYTYFVPEQDAYVQPTFTADHDWLHLEARYNYEALAAAFVWADTTVSVVGIIVWRSQKVTG